ncbi:hypothetical protein [Campylobacter mucosalis]|nr:hypothetical protein [Campylobacter mucosalis]
MVKSLIVKPSPNARNKNALKEILNALAEQERKIINCLMMGSCQYIKRTS